MTTEQSLRADWIAIGVGAVALALILGELGFQYLSGMPPCHMCPWQSSPHIAAAIIGLVGGGFLPRRYAGPIAIAAIILVAASGLIGAYQTGMQWGLLTGPTACTSARYVLGSNVIPELSCDVLVPVFLGQGLAFWNALVSLGVAGIAGFLLLRTGRNA